jgi:hypothetical protein
LNIQKAKKIYHKLSRFLNKKTIKKAWRSAESRFVMQTKTIPTTDIH